MRGATAILLLALAGAQLARCGNGDSTANKEAELGREVEAAAAVSDAATEMAFPTYKPYVATKADEICRDGSAPDLQLNQANCEARYTPVYEAVSALNDQAAQLSKDLEEAQDAVKEKDYRISDLHSQIQDLEKQLAAQAKRWAAWLEGNVTQVELAGQEKANTTQVALIRTSAQLKLCKADLLNTQGAGNFTAAQLDSIEAELADAEAAKAGALARLAAAQAELQRAQQGCYKWQLGRAADLTAANSKIAELTHSLAGCVEEADAIAAVAEEWAAEMKEAQQAALAGDCREAVALIKASANDTQVALDECNAKLIRLQASSVLGEHSPVHARERAPAPAPEPEPVPVEDLQQAATQPALAGEEPAHTAASSVDKDAAAAPAPATADAPKEAANVPAQAPEASTAAEPTGASNDAADGAPAVAPKDAAAPAPAAAEAAFQTTEARNNKRAGGRKGSTKQTADNPFALP